ncbi:MAG TPA: hydantoinase/oxoprolinase family protein [Anaerolineae bacterium]|nr:hydantoinase/oxoprolinase family protein [Anaerolineae bacterium]HQI84203.1 hydantoinase/oxoprolinase family protein [Anaerolineae bacterium]
MHIALGIDTGGTYTDAVLVNQTNGEVVAATKALTTHRDLSIGIGQAIAGVFAPEALLNGNAPIRPADVGMVGLSTTLATNSIVEGQGSPVCLLLIGYDPALIRQFGFERELVTRNVVYVGGGHTIDGDEAAPLDEAVAHAAILAHRDNVATFAISGYFGVRNPAHELRVKALVEELTARGGGPPHPVTCGHELTTKLDAIRRATTAALNASLIPTLRDLIRTVRRSLDELGVAAPLMIVKGDGSLVRAEWAMQRPIETILSGPAASVVGAQHVAGRQDVWVIDVGGTTTDIAALRNGRPRLNPEGARVGGWRTMIEAADVYTVGLGGDSHVQWPSTGAADMPHPIIGPQRALPLCRLASEHPGIVDELRQQLAIRKKGLYPFLGQFVLLRRRTVANLSEKDQALLALLADGPRALLWFTQQKHFSALLAERVNRLIAQQAILRAAFTPTDALHVLGRFNIWDTEAARLGAEILAVQAGLSAEAFCERVVEAMSDRVAAELVSKIIADEVAPPDWDHEPVAAALLSRALGHDGASDLACQFTLQNPVVAVGAPVAAYLPQAAAKLHTELVIPNRAGVANAIGAVAGSVVQRVEALIRPVDYEAAYRLYLPGGNHDFETLDEAVTYAQAAIPQHLTRLMQRAGADHSEVTLLRDDRAVAQQDGEGQAIFLETRLTFSAVGRPAPVSGDGV